jgi:glycosyltransferase involved in cell wall biosynthesis
MHLARMTGLPVEWVGELDDDALEAEYQRADVMVQAARYEAFGMAIAEAVARGLPVVTPPAGVVEHLPRGAVVVTEDLRGAVRTLLVDPGARRAQSDRAWAAAGSLPDWSAQAALLRAVLS